MQNTSGVKKLLSFSPIYEAFQIIVGGNQARKWIAKNLWRLNGGEKVVDMGCGPGSVLAHLPEGINYIGFDLSCDYIKTASEKFRNRENVLFLEGTSSRFLEQPDYRLHNADLVMCNGLLQHLDDNEVLDTLRLAKELVAPTGRFVIIDVAYLVHQGFFSKMVMNQDRGRNIRTEADWKQLVGSVFESFSTNIATGLTRIPYIHIFIECWKKPQ